MRSKMILAVLVAGYSLSSVPAWGQAVSGSITGLVTDSSAAAVSGATVTVQNVGTRVATQVTTTDTGYYAVLNLIPGTYSVVAEAQGFKTFRVDQVAVNLNSTVRVDCSLVVGSISESVTVSAESALLKTEKADVSGLLAGRTLNELPVIGRNVSQLISILPGAVRGGAAFVGENPSGDTNGFVNGLGGGNNYHQLDGIDNQETIQGVAMVNPAIDSLQEMKITTNSYDAEFGQVAGAIFQASTKSGTNAFHGSAFEYLQNDKLFARNPWTQSTTGVAPWRWNQFGGSVGGPIVKNKVFFFGDWQALRSRNGSTTVMGLPTPDMRRGDLSALASQYPIYDPSTGDANGRGRTQFANNMIPASRLDPATQRLVAMLPDPNTVDPTLYTRNYTKSGSFVSDTDAADGRVDYNVNDKTRMFGRYTFLRSRYDAPPIFGTVLGGPGFGPQAEVGGTRTQNLSWTLTRVIRPNLMAEFRFGFSRFRSNLAQTDVGLSTANDIGIPGINKGNDPFTDGLPQMNLDGPILNFYMGNPFANFYQVEQTFQYATNWSYTKGSHTAKWGVDLRPRARLQRIDKSFRGSFNFSRFGTASADTAATTGLGFASFLLGHSNSYSRGTYIQLPIEYQDRYGAYFQDQWRITSKLSLNLGIRWEYYSPTYSDDQGREANFDFATGNMVLASLGDVSKYANVQPRYNNLAPRFGLAYTIDAKTVLRVGYGRSYAINSGGANFGTYCCQWPIGNNQAINSTTNYAQIFPLSQGPPPVQNVAIPSNGVLPVPPGQMIFGRPFDDKITSQDSYNVTVQRQFGYSWSTELGWVGGLGRHLFRAHEANPAVPGPGALIPRKPYGTLYGFNQSINMRSNEGNSRFNSLQARIEKRFASGYQLQASFTWQKTIVDSYQNPFDRGMYPNLSGPAKWLTLSHVWELPFGPGKAFAKNATGLTRLLVAGWQFNGITQFQDGVPLSPTMIANTLNVDNYSQVPDRVGSGAIANPSNQAWFDATAFAIPSAYRFGTSGLGVLTGPGWWVADLALDKNFQFTERVRLTLRWQLFNAFNHNNPGNPDTRIDAPVSVAAHITSVQQNMRRQQIGLHLYF
jgi:hypothetical protein